MHWLVVVVVVLFVALDNDMSIDSAGVMQSTAGHWFSKCHTQ